jgi:hypothetical protein
MSRRFETRRRREARCPAAKELNRAWCGRSANRPFSPPLLRCPRNPTYAAVELRERGAGAPRSSPSVLRSSSKSGQWIP